MSEYNRHKWAMEWMHGGGRDPNGRSLDEEIKIGKEDWMERQRVSLAEKTTYNWEEGNWWDPEDQSVGNTKILEDFEITDEMRRRPNAEGGHIPQLVQPGPGRQGYAGDDELGRGLTQFVDPKNDKIYYRFETKFPDGSYYRKRLEKNPENLKIMKGIQKKQHKLLQKSYGGKILYPTELIEFVDNNPDLTHQQVANHFKKRVGPYGKEINRSNVIRTLERYDQLQEGYGRTADELYEASSRLNAGKHYIAEYEKTGDISRFRHQVKSALSNMNQQEKKMFKIGKFNAGTLPDQVLFNDLYRSSTAKDARWKLITEPPRDKSGKIKWTRETARNAQFIDTQNPKRKPITFKNLKSYMEEFMPAAAYDDAIKSIELNTFLKEQMVKYRGKETKLGGLLNKRIFSPDDWDDYMFGRSAFQRHHPGNIKDNWWKSENVFVDANQELNKIQQTFEANMKHLTGDARVKEMTRFGNEVDNIIKKSGPISVETPHGTFGRAADTGGVLEAIKKAAYSRSGDKALSHAINKLKKIKPSVSDSKGLLGEGWSKFAKAAPKTSGALAATGRFLFHPVEMGMLPLFLAGDALYQNYANKRDLQKVLDEIPLSGEYGIPQYRKDLIMEGYRQQARDKGGVGLETYAIDQPNISGALEKIGFGDSNFLAQKAGEAIAGKREEEEQAYEAEKERQRKIFDIDAPMMAEGGIVSLLKK